MNYMQDKVLQQLKKLAIEQLKGELVNAEILKSRGIQPHNPDDFIFTLEIKLTGAQMKEFIEGDPKE